MDDDGSDGACTYDDVWNYGICVRERGCGRRNRVDPDVIRALVLNIRYDGEKTVLTTGCAYQTFTMDKSADTVWDKALKK